MHLDRSTQIGVLVTLLFLLGLGYQLRSEWRLVNQVQPLAWVEDVTADCAVVLTGGPGRIREGLDLIYRGQVKKLIISGVHPSAEWRDIVPQWEYYSGVSLDDIVLEKRSTTTYGNATQTLPLAEAMHCQSIALVTSTLHMHRAFRTFKSVFGQDYHLIPYSMIGSESQFEWISIFIEVIKSTFYSVWTY